MLNIINIPLEARINKNVTNKFIIFIFLSLSKFTVILFKTQINPLSPYTVLPLQIAYRDRQSKKKFIFYFLKCVV